MSSTPRDVSGLLGVLLVLNDVLAHPAALHLFAFVSRRCGNEDEMCDSTRRQAGTR